MTQIKQVSSLKAYLILLCLVLTLINIDKAYHIDDTFHLEAAEHIVNHPLKPMSGCINWDNKPTPMHMHNQPPLFFFLIGIYQTFFGKSEIALHLLISIFTFLSLWYFYKLMQFLEVKLPYTLLTIFAFCPAFIVNQNLMTDVPILALSLGFMYYLLKGQKFGYLKDHVFSVLFLTAGLLIKYSLLPLIFVILISMLAVKNYKKSLVLLIPLLSLILWSVWNLIEFGSVHILSRPRSEFNSENILAFSGTLGSISIFTGVFVYNLFPKKLTNFLILLVFGLFIALIPFVYTRHIEESLFNKYLNILFIVNGFILMLLIIFQTIKSLKSEKFEYLKTSNFPLALYIFGVSSFIILYAPFNATRHVLLLIPFILLFGHKQFEKTNALINPITVVVSIALGIILGISDWVYADFYRKNINQFDINSHKKVYSLGHWGWQWYSQKAGMLIYSKEEELNLRNGDILVFPNDISKQELNLGIQLDTIDFITEAPTFYTFFSGKKFASMYNSYMDKPAWSLSNVPIDTIFVCQVKKEIGVEELVNQIKKDETWFEHVKNKAIDRKISLDSMLILDAIWAIEQKRIEPIDAPSEK
jgi:hypothetical protein